jgi:hypothetical protein
MRKRPRSNAVVVSRSDADLERLLNLYLAEDLGAFEAVNAMSAHDPDQCWRFLEIVRSAKLPEQQIARLSAGPFEDLMKRYGGEFIARVEAAARTDPAMRVLVATVWRAGMSDELWSRILALRSRGENTGR